MSAFTDLESKFHDLARRLDAGDAALDIVAPKVSAWDVRNHIDHTLRVLAQVTAVVAKKKLVEGPGISLLGRAILSIGRIPRGRAKSPEMVLPQSATTTELRETLATVQTRLAALAGDREYFGEQQPFFKHPSLGGLTPRQAVRFLSIHTGHHLKIICEIEESASL